MFKRGRYVGTPQRNNIHREVCRSGMRHLPESISQKISPTFAINQQSFSQYSAVFFRNAKLDSR